MWQNRFFSCPLDRDHLWTALRYVDLNPARAHLAEEAAGRKLNPNRMGRPKKAAAAGA